MKHCDSPGSDGEPPTKRWRGAAQCATRSENPDADLRILLAHFPDVAADLPAGACSLLLCGHLHGGQICLPSPFGKVKLAHARGELDEGVFRHRGTTVVVSRGTWTTLVPIRFLARPEACLLRLRPG